MSDRRRSSLHTIMDGRGMGKVESAFYSLGKFSANNSLVLVIVGYAITIVCTVMLFGSEIETEADKLWIEQGGRVAKEVDYTDTYSDKYVGGDGQMFLGVGHRREDLISEEFISEYITMSTAINGAEGVYNGVTFSYADVATAAVPYLFQPFAISPLDCFQEGAFNFPPSHSMGLGLWSPAPTPVNGTATMSAMLSAGFDIFLDNVPRNATEGPLLNVIVTTYSFCPWVRALNLGPDGLIMNPTMLGSCRPFALDPLTSPQTPGGNDDYIALSNFYYFVTFATLDFTFGNETMMVDNTRIANPMYDPDYAALPSADPNYVIESLVRQSAPDRTQYQDALTPEAKKEIMDMAFGHDTHAWLDYGDNDVLHRTAVSGTCALWDGGPAGLQIFSFPPTALIFGGIDDLSDPLSPIRAMETVFFTNKKDTQRNNMNDATALFNPRLPQEGEEPWTSDQAKDILREVLIDFVDTTVGEEALGITRTSFSAFSSVSFKILLEEASGASAGLILGGYILLFCYASFSLTSFKDCQGRSRASVGLLGVLTVALGVGAALGFTVGVFGIKFTPASTQVLPFLLLGLGVDDMFILAHNYNAFDSSKAVPDITGECMAVVGPSITLTSVTNAIVFIIGTLTKLPLVTWFSIQASFGIIFMYVMMLLVFPAILSMDARRLRASKMDVLCCLSATPSGDTGSEEESKGFIRGTFLPNFYLPLLRSVAGRALVGVIFGVLILLALIGAGDLEDGIEMHDVVPETYAEYEFLQVRLSYFSFYDGAIVLREQDVAMHQPHIMEMWDRVRAHHLIVPGARSWMEAMLAWGLPCYEGQFGMEEQDPAIFDRCGTDYNPKCLSFHPTTYGFCGPKLAADACATALPSSWAVCGASGTESCFDATVCSDSSTCVDVDATFPRLFNPNTFDMCFDLWSMTDLERDLLVAKIKLNPAFDQAEYDANGYSVANTFTSYPLQFSAFNFFANNLRNTKETVSFLKDIRAILELTYSTVPAYPTGNVFVFNEQYVTLRATLTKNVLLAVATAGIVMFCLLMAVQAPAIPLKKQLIVAAWAGVNLMMIVFCVIFLLVGFLSYFGIKLNAIPAVSVIMTAGVAVEFTAHLILAFINSGGTQNERMGEALDHMFVPILDGSISTLLGVIMMAFSDFPFIVQYFFVLYLLIILFGFLCGLTVLPVMLALAGPPGTSQVSGGMATKKVVVTAAP